MREPVEKYIKKADELSEQILSEEGKIHADDQALADSITSGQYAGWRNQHLNRFDKQAVKKRVDEELNLNKGRVIQMPKWWSSVAAILVIGLLMAGGYWIYTDIQKIEEEQILPGSSLAYLEIDSQEKIELTGKDTLLLFKESKAELDSGKIVYNAGDAASKKVEYHKINVPRNGEFYVVLSDGTKVWVNSASSLGFRSRFDGKNRIVDLEGEAYFEVAKNANQPFIVRTKTANVRVLGTHFNLKA
jgi:hypothetical protein